MFHGDSDSLSEY